MKKDLRIYKINILYSCIKTARYYRDLWKNFYRIFFPKK